MPNISSVWTRRLILVALELASTCPSNILLEPISTHPQNKRDRMNKDLHQFLAEMRQLGPDYFASVSRQVDPIYEPSVIQQKFAERNEYPVIRFENVAGADMPLVTNLFGKYELLGLALGVEPDQPQSSILTTFRERIAKPIETTSVKRNDAPVKQVVWQADEIDINRIPVIKHAEKNSGKYISIGVLVVRDLETGILNAGVYRHEIQGKDRIACMFNPAHNVGYIYRKYQELNRPMEAVLFIGHHPAAILGALSKQPIDSDEYQSMGALMGESLEVVDGDTVDIPVPAWAEIAIEGVLDPAEETSDGPFAEYTGYYGPKKDPVGLLQVRAVTMREDAIYHDLDPAHREHNSPARSVTKVLSTTPSPSLCLLCTRCIFPLWDLHIHSLYFNTETGSRRRKVCRASRRCSRTKSEDCRCGG